MRFLHAAVAKDYPSYDWETIYFASSSAISESVTTLNTRAVLSRLPVTGQRKARSIQVFYDGNLIVGLVVNQLIHQ